MKLPDFITNARSVELPVPEDVVTATGFRSDQGLVVFFNIHKNLTLPAHSHGAQWGTVLQGSIDLTIDGQSRKYLPGESYDIPAGAVHSAKVPAGSRLIDLFAEPDRYPLKDA